VIKGFLFDLDGVLVDTAKYHFLAWKRLADELEIPFTEDDNEQLKGVSRMRSLDIILDIGQRKMGQEEKENLAVKKNNWYVEYVTQMPSNEMLPGAVAFLQQTKAKLIKIGLGSSSKNANTILNQLNLMAFFDAVITGNELTEAKPDPQVFLKGAAALNLEPGECLVFEDAAAGVEAAKNAGMKCIGIGSNEILCAADIVVNGLHAISVDEALNL